MQLGLVSAILPELSLEQVMKFASEQGFDALEVMCWPKGKAERRYAGVTHIDVTQLSAAEIKKIKALQKKCKVNISGLGYYPNPLVADDQEAGVYIEHIKKVITASAKLGIGRMNTFIGRDPTKSFQDNWVLFDERWPQIIQHAEKQKVKVGIENCPMYFSGDEWPLVLPYGVKCLAV
jgi:sugar phosphate isomerase/epimerase